MKIVKPLLKSLFLLSLVFVLAFGNAGSALAARSGGRIGGGSFRRAPAPSRTYAPPGGGYRSPGYGYGGGIGFPFLLPFFGFGGFGSLFTILIFIAIANFIVSAVRNSGIGSGDSSGSSYSTSKVSVARVQVGLLADARELQNELDELARRADTGTPEGRAKVLQESTLALLRNPEYWVYGSAEAKRTDLDAAEAQFNQYALAERSKFAAETLSNIENQLEGSSNAALAAAVDSLSKDLKQDNSGYIIATLVVGATGKLELPAVNDSADMRQILQQVGGLGRDRVLAIEILWTPQAKGDTLTQDDLLANYPNLKLI